MRATRAKWQICPLISARSSCELTCYIDLHRVCTYRGSPRVSSLVQKQVVGPFISTRLTPIFQVIDKTFIRYRIAILFLCWTTCKSTHVPLLTTTALLFSPACFQTSNLQPWLCVHMCACAGSLLDDKIISMGQIAASAQSSGLSLSANISVLRAAEANTVCQSRSCQNSPQRPESAGY